MSETENATFIPAPPLNVKRVGSGVSDAGVLIAFRVDGKNLIPYVLTTGKNKVAVVAVFKITEVC